MIPIKVPWTTTRRLPIQKYRQHNPRSTFRRKHWNIFPGAWTWWKRGNTNWPNWNLKKPPTSVRIPRRYFPSGDRLCACRKNTREPTGVSPGLTIWPRKMKKLFSTGACPACSKRMPTAPSTSLKETIELNPKNHLAYNYLGKAYGLKKDYPNEEAGYVKALGAQGRFRAGSFQSWYRAEPAKEF